MKNNIPSVIFGLSFLSVVFSPAALANETASPTLTAAANDNQLREYFDDELDSAESTPSRFAQAPAAAGAVDAAAKGSVDAAGAVAGDGAAGVKKKKMKKKAVSTEGHGLQDSGLPYTADVTLSFKYNSNKKTLKYSDNSVNSSTTAMALDIAYLRVLGPIEVGPLLSYLNQTDTTGVSATTNVVLKTSGLGFGLGFVLNIGDINQGTMVPYVGLGVLKESLTTTQSATGSASETKTTESKLNMDVELGLKIFMGSHVALKPFFAYKMLLSGDIKEAITGSETVVGTLTGNEISAGMGIATYF